MDIVMQRMTISNVEADMDRLIKVGMAFLFLLLIKVCYTYGSDFPLCVFDESEAGGADGPAGITLT